MTSLNLDVDLWIGDEQDEPKGVVGPLCCWWWECFF